jgi:hypothetical protein
MDSRMAAGDRWSPGGASLPLFRFAGSVFRSFFPGCFLCCLFFGFQFRPFLRQRLHGREQQDVPDRRGTRQEHDEAVDADAQSPRGRQAVHQRIDEVFVHHAGFQVTVRPFFHLFHKAFPLVDRIIQFRKAVAQLAAIDESLRNDP